MIAVAVCSTVQWSAAEVKQAVAMEVKLGPSTGFESNGLGAVGGKVMP